jgi:hypothetical protein
VPDTVRKDKIEVAPELLRKLYVDCGGWIQRIHEKLTEEEGIKIGYSTLARRVRELGVGQSPERRCGRVADEAGADYERPDAMCGCLTSARDDRSDIENVARSEAEWLCT